MKKLFRNIALFAATAVAAVGCAPEPSEVIDTIELDRALTPLEFKASVIASKGTDVEFSWEVMEGVEKYTLELFAAAEDAEGNTIAPNYDEVSPLDIFIVLPDEVPFIIENLEVDKSFYARVRSHKANLEPSKWAVLENDFSTSAVRSNLYPKVTERGTDYIVVSWDATEDKGDLTSLRVAPVMGGEEVVIALESGDKDGCSKKVEGLAACTHYRFELVFGKSGSRGITSGWTRPVIGEATAINTADALVAAITGATGDVVLKVAYNDGVPYEITSALEPAFGLTIYGEPTGDGKKPVLSNLDLRPKVAISKIHIQDVVIDGAKTAGFAIDNKGAFIDNITLMNCDITGYTKGILYGSGGDGSGCDEIRIEGCYIYDLNNEVADNGNAVGGGDLLDFRNGTYKNFNIVNNTWSYCGRSFLRIDMAVENVVVANNTFNAVGVVANSNGIFYLSKAAPTASFVSSKNVFMNMNTTNETILNAKKIGLGKNGSGGFAPKFDNCYFYNVITLDDYNYFDYSKYTAWGAETTFSQTDALADGGMILTEDPCVNSAGAKFYLNTTSDISAKKIGDPRWWNAQQPVIIRATELTLVSEPYVWDFTTKSKFDTETIEKATIIDNVRIYGSADVPTQVVMGTGVQFSKGAMVNAEGEPEYSAVGVLTEGYGAIVVTAQGESGIETMQVLAGGDRYTILADGEPHKVVLGDLAGENNIYVLASSAVTLTKVEWTKDLTPDQTVFPLAKPVITLSAASLDEGTAEAVTVSWEPIENADKYVLTGLGQTLEFAATAELSLTVPAEQVAVLPVGEYPITLTAYPVETSTKYSASETATATFKIKKVVVGGEVTLLWNFSDTIWETNVFDWLAPLGSDGSKDMDVTVDGLRVVAGGSNIRGYLNETVGNYLQPNGGGSTTKRCFSFTAPANGTLRVKVGCTGSEDLTRVVRVQVGEDGTVMEQPGGHAEPTWVEYDIKADNQTVYIYPSGGLRFYAIEYTYVAAAPKAHYVWDFSTPDWVAKLVEIGTSNRSDVDITVEGLSVLSGGGTIKASDTTAGQYYIQPGGKGDANKRYFKFTAPGSGTLKVWTSTTNNTADDTRKVAVQQGEDETTLVEKSGGSPSNEAPTENEFTVEEGEVRIWASGNALRFYKFEYQQD